ncbi:MAG TPA: MarR family winged helix-turn-helix transcriptional regulator [Acidimicrobiia bacterium]
MQQLSLDEVTEAVLSASRVLVAVSARSLGDVAEDVTLPQYRTLVLLCAHGPLGMSELTDHLGCAPSSATRLCDRLVARKLASRRHRAANRREVEVAATAAGGRLVAAVTDRRRAEISRVLEAMPGRHRGAMVRALRAFAAAAGEVPDQAWATGWSL